ncbi:hypothetical protein [Pseudothermotoga sp.]|nr:hypothetical protein [Pseudothermotoga sp.]MDW8139183.1 hypothetical protein [Pseudothermotoga sp.]
MSFLNQLFQTLKLELGFIKIYALDLSISEPNIKCEQSDLNLTILSAILTCHINKVQLYSSLRINHHLIESSSVKIKDQTLKQKEPLTEDVKFEKSVSTINSVVMRIEPPSKKINLKFDVILKESSFVVKVKDRNVPLLKTVRFKPSTINDDDKKKILKSIRTLISQENLGSFSFIGFYKNVPIDCVKKMVVVGRELIVELEESTKGTKKDLVVLLAEKGYIFLSIL